MNDLEFDFRSDCWVWGKPNHGFGIHIVQTHPVRYGGSIVKNKSVKELESKSSIKELYDECIKEFKC